MTVSKKVKCLECKSCMFWCIPKRVTAKNYDYATECLLVAKKTIVCGQRGYTKKIYNTQYCKFFKQEDKENIQKKMAIYEKEVKKLKEMITQFESEREKS